MLFILIYLIVLKVLHVLAIIWVLIWLLGIYCLYAILVLSMGFNVKKKKRICIKFIAHVKVLFCYPLRYEIQIKCEKSLKLDCKM